MTSGQAERMYRHVVQRVNSLGTGPPVVRGGRIRRSAILAGGSDSECVCSDTPGSFSPDQRVRSNGMVICQ